MTAIRVWAPRKKEVVGICNTPAHFEGGSVAFKRGLSKGFLVVIGLTAWLFLAGIIILPGLGPTHADDDAQPSEDFVPPAAP